MASPARKDPLAGVPDWARKEVEAKFNRASDAQKVALIAAVAKQRTGGSGITGRLGKVVNGFGGALRAPFGLAKDLATAPFDDDDEFDGFVGTIFGATKKRGGEALAGTVAGVSATVGALPAGVRNPAGAVIGTTLRGLETGYREGVAEPISTAMTAASLASAPGGGGVGGLLRGENWRKADAIAENRSPGQAIAYALGTKDITNEAEVAKVAGSDWFGVATGTADAIFRMTLDPSIVGGKLVGAARVKYLVRPIRSAEDINRAANSSRLSHVANTIQGMKAAEIRHRFFPDHINGAVIASTLADAPTVEAKMTTFRALMGDVEAHELVRSNNAALAGKLDRLKDEKAALRAYDDDLLFADPTRVKQLDAEIAELYPTERSLARADAAFATVQEVPRVSLAGTTRAKITRSDFYQASPFAKPLRKVFDMAPQNLVDLHSPAGDVQVSRMLEKSALPRETRDSLRGEYMAALSPPDRQVVLIKAEEAAVRSLAEAAGMTVGEIDTILASAAGNRGRAAQVLQSRKYDGKGRSIIRYEDPEGVHELHLPVFATQEANHLPLVDMDLVRDATKPIARFRMRHPSTDVPSELLTSFMKVWRPSVLLRGAWPIRVVGDEQLRIIAKIGALAQAKELGGAFRQRLKEGRAIRSADTDEAKDALRAGRGVGRPLRSVDYEMQSAFGVPGEAVNAFKAMVSSRASFGALVDQTEKASLNRLRKETGEWRTIAPDEPSYGKAYEHAVNMQLGQDAMARKLMEGQTPEQVARWLRSTPEGRVYAGRNKVRGANPERWAKTAAEIVDDLLPTPELREIALKRTITSADLTAALPDAAARPLVHGEIINQAMGKSVVTQFLGDVVEKGFSILGSKPSDTLSRNRYFDHMYRAEAERLVNLADDQVRATGQRLTTDQLDEISGKARVYALGETKQLLYDLAEKSELGEMLRNFVPFLGAFQEVATRWTGLAVENPAFIARVRQVWQAPERAGIVVDENGNRIHADGTATSPLGERTKAGADRYFTIRLPEGIGDLPGLNGLKTKEAVSFNKDSFNMVLQGWPGSGPVVQVPVNELVKDRPELADSLKFILPFGTQETRDLLMPATAKRAATLAAGEDDRAYATTRMRIFYDKWTDYQLGKRDTKPTLEEVTKETDAFFKLRMAASFFSPAAPNFLSPYQSHIEAYRALREKDPEGALDAFIDMYGEEYIALTQSVSKSLDGVPPTLEGRSARKEHQALIEKYPELGGLIIGKEGAGEFNGAVYDAQFKDRLKPGSGNKQRETPSFEEAAAKPEIALAWRKFGQAVDLIDAERIQRGLPSLDVKAAADLAALKRGIITKLEEQYPDWAKEFGVTDRNRWKERIKGFNEIVKDPKLAGREDMAGLKTYLEARDLMLNELARRKKAGGAISMTATSNMDLAQMWGAITGKLVEQNLAFGDLYHRWLERDPMEGAA